MSQNETIEFACPNCNMDLKVPSQLAGVTGPCPHCQVTITAPTPAPATPQSAPAAVAAAAPTYYQPQPQQATQPQQVQPPAETQQIPQEIPPQDTPQAIPPEKAPRPPLQAEDVRPHRSVSTTESKKIPLSSSVQPTAQASHGRRKIWPGIIFPALFLALAAVVVYLILDLMGILKFGNDTVKKTPSLEPATSSNHTDGIQVSSTSIDKPVPDPVLVPADPATIEPTPEPTAPEPGPITHDPQDINKPGQVPDGLPDLVKNEGANFEEGDDAIKKRAAAADEARETLKRFLSARNFEDRKPFLTKSAMKDEELIASCIGKPFPKSGEPTLRIMRERKEDRSLEAFFSVDFDQPDGEPQKIVLIRMISYSDSEPLLIHVDPFVDLYDERIKKFAQKPVEGTRTFHSLIEYSQFCFDDIPRHATMSTISFYPNQADSGPPLTKAYLSHESKPFKNIQDFASAGDRVPSTLSVSWDTTTDPQRPFLEVIRLEAINWTL